MSDEFRGGGGGTAAVAVLLLLLAAVGGSFYLAAAQPGIPRQAQPRAAEAAPEPRRQPPDPPTPPASPRTFEGKVIRLAPPAGTGGLALVDDAGTTRRLVEDEGSRMLAWDDRLRNRPVRLTAVPGPGARDLRVVYVQTVKDGQAFDVDYWCEVCQISMTFPGTCYCCGDETVFRERPAR